MELLTVKETAAMLRVSQITVRRYIASGKLAAVRVGRNIRIRRDAVEDMTEPALKFNETKKWGYGKSDEWIREHIDEHPLMQLAGMIKDEGPDDYSVNHDKYLAEAYADTHEDDESPIRNPDGDTTLTPREWLLKNDPMFWTLPGGAHEGEPEYIERCAALMEEARAKHTGLGKSLMFDISTDIAENHDEQLAEENPDEHMEVDPVVSGIDPRFVDKTDEWMLKNHPLLKFAGIFEDREGKTDIAENHDAYLADAYTDLHEK